MSDDLKLLLDYAGDEDPPDDFARTLRAMVLDEAERVERQGHASTVSGSGEQFGEVHEITIGNLVDEHDRAGSSGVDLRWIAAAAVLIALLIGAFNVLSDGGRGALETATTPTPDTTSSLTTAQGAVVSEGTAAFNPEATIIEPRERVSDSGTEPRVLQPGAYSTASLGTSISIDLPVPYDVLRNGAGLLTLDSELAPVQQRLVQIGRISELSDPTRPNTPFGELDSSWPTNDVEGWIDALSDSFATSEVQQVTLGGAPALRFTIWATGSQCQSGLTCGYFATNNGLDTFTLEGGHRYEVWIIEQGDEDPISVIVDDPRFDDLEWQAEASELVATIGLGTAEPNPVVGTLSEVESLRFLDGIQIDLSSDDIAFWDNAGAGAIGLGQWFAETRFLARPSDVDGVRIETADDLLNALSRDGTVIDETGPTVIDGLEARTFDIEGGDEPGLFVDGETEHTWKIPARGRLWVVQHPERGVLIVTAEARGNVAVTWPLIDERTEEIVAGLIFVDFDENQ